jgi:excisionase family DNA binding protein
MSTDEAAAFLKMGKTRLYALTREGKIPANRVGKKWTYEREALTEWLRGSHSLTDLFMSAPAASWPLSRSAARQRPR